MRWFKRALGFALVVILALATLVFVLENQQDSILSYLGFLTPQLPVAPFVIAAFVFGRLISLLLAGLMVSRLRYRLRQVELKLSRADARRLEPQDLTSSDS